MSNYDLNKAWTQGYDQGLQDGLAVSEASYTRGFSYGFWSAILLVAGVVMGGLLVMRVM